ncbi:glycerophosphodiester phosphodiesterase [Streptomyces calidiresistens]|uniref:Glycerophosphodiester phosphodiesterase n=1 Tax=Streptomyces calidiresistens TaxID=1485586 RepID=A0A7W3T696_9ACTN|nr:glycerophosphodiester phosphodiesterase [Streptomyces calidiresistens]
MITLGLTLLVPIGPWVGPGSGAATASALPLPPAAVGTPVVVAHRGASGHAPENTLAAVDAAAEQGISWVEVDVQRTRDGELVLLHDTTLRRTTDVAERFPDRAPWYVGDMDLAEVRRLDAGSWFSPEFAGERVPTLRELLRRLDHHGQRLLLEIKAPSRYPGIEREILRELAREGWLGPMRLYDSLILQSFDAESVRAVHRMAPQVKTGFLGSPEPGELADHAAFTHQINSRYTDLTADRVAAVRELRGPHGRRMEVFTWTVDDGPTAVRLAGMGVDGIITNRPGEIRDALRGADRGVPAPAGSPEGNGAPGVDPLSRARLPRAGRSPAAR